MSSRQCCECSVPKGAILVALCGALLWPVGTYRINRAYGQTVRVAMYDTFFLCGISYPVVGWIIDSWIGRYHIFLPGLCLGFTAVIVSGIGAIFSYCHFVLNVFSESTVPVIESTLFIGFVLRIVGLSFFTANALPYAVDHLIDEGASGKQLSDFIRWYLWGVSAIFSAVYAILCILESSLRAVVLPLMQCLCVTIAIVGYQSFKHLLLKTPLNLRHPIRQITQVLNYARKHKIPERRSAFTYWEEDYPSRIDLGKIKYGGPFTEEEVEDVKTVLRLIVLMVLATVPGVQEGMFSLRRHLEHTDVGPSTLQYVYNLLFVDTYLLVYLAPVILLPIYQFIIYPMFQYRLPNLLTAMSYSIILSLISTMAMTCIESVGHIKTPEAQCFLKNRKSQISTGDYWSIIPLLLHAVSMLLMHSSCLVFVIAQSPHHMRGFLTGLYYTNLNLWEMLGISFSYIFKEEFGHNCLFYSFLIRSALIVVVLLLYSMYSYYYKLRIREEVLNFNIFAEEHFESSQREKRKYYNESLLG